MKMLKRWWPTCLVVLVVLYATLWPDPLPDDSTSWFFPGIDKLIHAIMMGGLVGAVLFDRCRAGMSIRPRIVAWVGLAVALFCLADEWAQSAMGFGRTYEALDLAADFLGIVVAMLTAPPAVKAVLRRKDR